MIAWLWKDLVVNRAMLLVGLLLVVVTFCFALGQQIYSMTRFWPPVDLADAALSALSFSAIVSLLVITICGCQLMSGERVTGTFEFASYLPVTRTRMVFSRLLAGLLYFLGIVGINLLMYWIVIHFSGVGLRSPNSFWSSAFLLVVVAFALFGFGWLGSSFLGRPTMGFAAAIVLAVGSFVLFSWVFEGTTQAYFIAAQMLTGTAAIALGSYWFIRGIEP